MNNNNFRNQILHCVLNKLEGSAQVVANTNDVSDWETLKNVLIRNFGDQRR